MASIVLGLDIGGANLKAATSVGRAVSVPFALWKQPDALPAVLAELVSRFPEIDRVAVTMTGELCDCFQTKREGVAAIVHASEIAANRRQVRFWTTAGRFVSANDANAEYLNVAAANWHALATYVGQNVATTNGILLDIGTTTSDIIPIVNGKVATQGLTDPTRLQHGELVYTGVRRTPATTILGLEYAAEFFATTHDVYVLLGMMPEDPSDTDTADNRPVTIANAHARLSRMICGDPEIISPELTRELAIGMMTRQRGVLAKALSLQIERLSELAPRPFTAIVSGSGAFITRPLVTSFENVISLSDHLGPELSSAAPAYAVAILGEGEL